MPDPIRIRAGSARKHRPETGRTGWMILGLPDWIRLATTWHNQPELNLTDFVLYYPGRLWKNGTESKCGKPAAGRLHTTRNPAR